MDNQIKTVDHELREAIAVKQAMVDDTQLVEKIATVAQVVTECYNKQGKVLIAGNGGSAADAQHIAGELVSRFYFDRPALSAVALTTDTSILTAIGNDYGYVQVFARQVQANGSLGDVFIGISTSGNSENVIHALVAAKEKGLLTVGLVGSKPCKMDELCDYVIKVPSSLTPRIQEAHITIGHIICGIVEANLFKS